MRSVDFSQRDLAQMEERGITPEALLSQLRLFREGISPLLLESPATLGNGIRRIERDSEPLYLKAFHEAASGGRFSKFVPASGAATRMFQVPLRWLHEGIPDESGDPQLRLFSSAIGEGCFPFHPLMESHLRERNLPPSLSLWNEAPERFLSLLLTGEGLALAESPKALLPFHLYSDGPRTPLEEHMEEASRLVTDGNGKARLHLTLSESSVDQAKALARERLPLYTGRGIHAEVSFSVQSPSTDTIAVNAENLPFRDHEGRLLFRPGGHGALLKNLEALQGDIVFLRNIDNVAPLSRLEERLHWSRLLGGLLVLLQEEAFSWTDRLKEGEPTPEEKKRLLAFLKEGLSLSPSEVLFTLPWPDSRRKILSLLERPMRVCGMVRNQGEPGGGPFWVSGPEGPSLQIVESSQVDRETPSQRALWESSTHFNPVDLVCALRDRQGRPYPLALFSDPSTSFLSIKSKGGKTLKALEHPGLWNGAMAHWTTVFGEVPLSTFTPVKTLFDLLRPEHKP